MNRGAVDTGILFFGIGRPLGPAFEASLAARVAARMAA
jgi:hypothetical protein